MGLSRHGDRIDEFPFLASVIGLVGKHSELAARSSFDDKILPSTPRGAELEVRR